MLNGEAQGRPAWDQIHDDFEQEVGVRTALWLSRQDREMISSTPLCIVGCGGTGSLAATFAGRLGFRDISLVDRDLLEASNLNRFINAGPDDLGRPKADILRGELARRSPQCTVRTFMEEFPNDHVIQLLRDSDVLVIGCVDSVKPRIELDLACRRFGRVYVDAGTGFTRDDQNSVSGAGGQVLVSRDGSACVMCLGFPHILDSRDYVAPGAAEPEPSVLTLNVAVVALAMDVALRVACGAGLPFNKLSYDRVGFSLHTTFVNPDPLCRVCGAGAEQRVSAILPQE